MQRRIVYSTLSQRADTGKIPVTLDRPPGGLAPRSSAGVDFGMVLHMMRIVRSTRRCHARRRAEAGRCCQRGQDGEQWQTSSSRTGQWQVSIETSQIGRRVSPGDWGGWAVGGGLFWKEDQWDHGWRLGRCQSCAASSSPHAQAFEANRERGRGGGGRMGSHAETVRKRWRAAGEGAGGGCGAVRCLPACLLACLLAAGH